MALAEERNVIREGTKVYFAERLKGLRTKIGLSQDAFAKSLGVSRAAIAYYESGERVPDITFLSLLSSLSGCSLDYLLGRSNNMIPVHSDFAADHEMSDEEYRALESLLSSFSFPMFIARKDAQRLFESIDAMAIISANGFEHYASEIVEFNSASTFGKIIKNIYEEIRNDVTTNDSSYKVAADRSNDYAKLLEEKWMKEDVDRENERKKELGEFRKDFEKHRQEMINDPVIMFRTKLLYGEDAIIYDNVPSLIE